MAKTKNRIKVTDKSASNTGCKPSKIIVPIEPTALVIPAI